jgi:glycosyltransferase involved in cell wall biosynthesis
MDAPELSVVIPARNAAATLGAQLDALASTPHPQMEVIVVDNGSTDDTGAVALTRSDRLDVRVVTASSRPGAGYARNVGIASSRADRIAMCDADDEVRPGWANGMSAALSSHQYVTGPLLLDRINPVEAVDARGRAWADQTPLAFDTIPFANGSNVGIRRELIDQIGWFREDMRVVEDVELGIRAWEAGIACVHVPEAAIDYRLRSSPAEVFAQAKAYGVPAPWLRERAATLFDVDAETRRRQRRWLWLVRHLPSVTSRTGRLRWLWVAGQQVGDLRGRRTMASVPLRYDEDALVGPTEGSPEPPGTDA